MVVVDLLYILQIWINGLFKWLIYQYIKHLNTTKEKAIWCMKCLKVVVYLKVWQWIWQGPEIWCKSSQVAIVACLMSPLAANFVNEQIKFHSEKSGRNFRQLVDSIIWRLHGSATAFTFTLTCWLWNYRNPNSCICLDKFDV